MDPLRRHAPPTGTTALIRLVCVLHSLILALSATSAFLGFHGGLQVVLLVGCTAYALGVLLWCWRRRLPGPRERAMAAVLHGGPPGYAP